MNIYTMQFNLILLLRQFQTWSTFYTLSGEFNAWKNSTNWTSLNGWNSKEKDGLSTISFEEFLPSTDFNDSDFFNELNNLDKLIEAHFKANENEFSDKQLSFESLRPEIPNSTSINHDINKRSPILPVIAAATFGSIAGAGMATLANTGSYLYNA
jgi:hypothetical protein